MRFEAIVFVFSQKKKRKGRYIKGKKSSSQESCFRLALKKMLYMYVCLSNEIIPPRFSVACSRCCFRFSAALICCCYSRPKVSFDGLRRWHGRLAAREEEREWKINYSRLGSSQRAFFYSFRTFHLDLAKFFFSCSETEAWMLRSPLAPVILREHWLALVFLSFDFKSIDSPCMRQRFLTGEPFIHVDAHELSDKLLGLMTDVVPVGRVELKLAWQREAVLGLEREDIKNS